MPKAAFILFLFASFNLHECSASNLTQIRIINMSSKKIIRLKTPTKNKQYARTPESTFANTRFIQLQTIAESHNIQYSETLRLTLINEINKLYRDLQAIKKEVEHQQRINIELHHENNRLKSHIQLLQKECENFKEMYDLERHNHFRLRNFYEERQRQWQYIVFEHKRMLEQFDRKHQTSLSKIEQLVQKQHDNKQENIQPMQNQQIPEKQQVKKLKRLTPQPNRKENIKQINDKQIKPQQAYYFTQINRLYTQQQKFAKKSQLALNQQSHTEKVALRNPEIDDLFDRIMRKTYYYFRQKSFSINQMKECEDMIKLKHAKTSTKERLLKTIKKLEFQAQNQNQLNTFSQYIEDLVINQQKMLRGDLVFHFIIEKLKQCEKLALTSNSQIQKIQLNSVVEGRQFQKNKIESKYDIQRLSRQNLQLLLNSTIKKPPKLGSQVSQNIRYSISSLQNLSDLIHGDTGGFNLQNKLIEQASN